MTNIKNLFEKRNESYQKQTDNILQLMAHVLEGVIIALDEDAGSEVTWEDVQMVPADDVILLTGFIQLNPGESVTLDTGRTINVTEENMKDFRRILRVAVPIDIAENGTVDDVADFFCTNLHNFYLLAGALLELLAQDLELPA